MKLLHVIGSMNPHTGGPCQTIRNFAPRFIELGNTLEVVCLNDPQSDFLTADAFPIHALGQGRGSWNYHAALPPWLEKNLSRFDAIILNGLWQFQGYALARASRKPGTPGYHIFPHGMLDPFFQKISFRPGKTMRNWLYWKLVEQRNVHQAAGLLFTSQEEMRLARIPFKPYRPKKEMVVGLGILPPPAYDRRMTEAFVEKCPGIKGNDYFLFLSRIHPKKGVELLIEGYSEFCRSASNSRGSPMPKLVIAGPGLDTAYGKKMQGLAVESGMADSVFWPGMLAGDAKWGALYGCNAFLLPSHQENFGLAVVEALACGRPVLISDQVNIWREIKEEGAALVANNSVAGVIQLLREWANLSPSAISQMTASAASCFQKHFSIESANQKLMEAVAVKV